MASTAHIRKVTKWDIVMHKKIMLLMYFVLTHVNSSKTMLQYVIVKKQAYS